MKHIVACTLNCTWAAIILLYAGPVDAGNGTPAFVGTSDQIATISSSDFQFNAWPVVFRQTVPLPGGRFARLGFQTTESTPRGAYLIAIYDSGGKRVGEVPLDAKAKSSIVWGPILQNAGAYYEVLSKDKGTISTFELNVYRAYHVPPGQYQNIVDPPAQLEEEYQFRMTLPLKQASRSVAMLSFNVRGRPAVCTGFMITDDYMVTNYHCIPDQAICETAVAVFGYLRSVEDETSYGESFKCSEIVRSMNGNTYDLSIIKLAGAPGQAGQYGHIALDDNAVVLGDPLIIIGYPYGNPEVASRKHCAVSTLPAESPTSPNPIDLGHTCDTDEGSSGSPVLSKDFKLVGIHHWGIERTSPKWSKENRAVLLLELRKMLQDLQIAKQ